MGNHQIVRIILDTSLKSQEIVNHEIDKVLCVGNHNGRLCVWALVHPNTNDRSVIFRIFSDNDIVPFHCHEHYIGTSYPHHVFMSRH